MAKGPKSKGNPRPPAEPSQPPKQRRASAALPAKPDVSDKPLTIVGIGASAGGLEAFTNLLQELPTELGAALVLVQHLAPNHESALPQLLAGATNMPVEQVRDGVALEANRVYIIAPNTQMSIEEGRLRLSPRTNDLAGAMAIDYFFRSLAEYAQGRAIGVILSGTASDGAQGLREIKAAGGFTLVEDPGSARYDGMPRAAIATGIIDHVLPLPELAAELVRLVQHPLVAHAKPRRSGEEILLPEDHLPRIFTLLRQAGGVDFSTYKPATLKRRIQRRMVLNKIGDIVQYIRFLEENPAEVRSLFQDMLIHVTRFFRDPDSFKALQTHALPKIAKARRNSEPIRIWVPGCATGEEVYSVAIAVDEFLREQGLSAPYQIFGTDVSDPAVEVARAGTYPLTIAEDVSPERLRRYFTRVEGRFRISKTIRDACVFARQDLTRDPPFSKLDLILCRNVLIYLGQMVQRKLINIFHYALKPGGFLLLGSAETVGTHMDFFATADKRNRLYCKRATGGPRPAEFPVSELIPGRATPHRPPHGEAAHESSLQHEVMRLTATRFAPPSVVVDEDLKIIQSFGRVSRFLELPAGDASLSILKMAREGLLYGLRTALTEAIKSKKEVSREGLRVKVNGIFADVDVRVLPLSDVPSGRHFLVLFQENVRPDKEASAKQGKNGRAAKGKDAKNTERLERELAYSRDYLQSIIQDLEAANEELQSANEEILSSNEELQSTNEELDTAREELQSTNEELNTVNEELHTRNDELSRANSDLLNLLGSVQIAIVMVSSDLRIRRFTPMAEKVLNLIPGDLGRPIGDINPSINVPDLEKLIAEVIDKVEIREQEVQDRNGTWYLLRVRPYKNIENKIDGAVLALFDVNDLKKQEAHVQEARAQEVQLRAARDYAWAIVDAVREPLMVLDGELRVRSINRGFTNAFHVAAEETREKRVYDLGNGQWNIPALRTALEEVLSRNQRVDDFRVEHDFPDIGRRVMLLNARQIQGEDGRPALILLAFEDVTKKGA